MRFLSSKSTWYWPLIIYEKVIIFCITILLISSVILSFELGEPARYLGKIGVLVIWAVSSFMTPGKSAPIPS